MKPLLLLHGAIGAATQLNPITDRLSSHFETYTLNFSGHGGRDLPSSYQFDLFAQDIIAWMEEHHLQQINIFGYSMGGYAALYLARHYPEKVGRIFTLATKFDWSEATAQKEIKMLDPVKIEEKIPHFAQLLQKRHAPHDWRQVLKLTADMMLAMGKDNPLKEEDFKAIIPPVLLSVGDKDTMVSIEETVEIFKKLPSSQLLVIPATQHPIEKLSLDRISWEIINWFQQE